MDGYKLAAQIVEPDSIKTKKTSLFVSNDYVAIGFITRFLEMGIAIPEQAAVAGFDDIRFSALCQVPLTTVSQQVFTIGRTAAEDLLNIVKKNGMPPFGLLSGSLPGLQNPYRIFPLSPRNSRTASIIAR
ncbi:hypothetical protein AGMMS49940_23580 [Spirochaetia bacterium]|nr:hypothetical protein AGMMS49940_23580 [Spirochaetia bacterium]